MRLVINIIDNSYRAFSLTWQVALLLFWNKRLCLHKNRVRFPKDWFGIRGVTRIFQTGGHSVSNSWYLYMSSILKTHMLFMLFIFRTITERRTSYKTAGYTGLVLRNVNYTILVLLVIKSKYCFSKRWGCWWMGRGEGGGGHGHPRTPSSRFFVIEHQYNCRDVTWKRSIKQACLYNYKKYHRYQSLCSNDSGCVRLTLFRNKNKWIKTRTTIRCNVFQTFCSSITY